MLGGNKSRAPASAEHQHLKKKKSRPLLSFLLSSSFHRSENGNKGNHRQKLSIEDNRPEWYIQVRHIGSTAADRRMQSIDVVEGHEEHKNAHRHHTWKTGHAKAAVMVFFLHCPLRGIHASSSTVTSFSFIYKGKINRDIVRE